MVEKKLLKKGLTHIISNKEGKIDEFTELFGKDTLEAFGSAGFINVRYLKWVKLRLADDYYKEAYGYTSYWYQRFKTAWDKKFHKTSK